MWDRLLGSSCTQFKALLFVFCLLPCSLMAFENDYEKALQAYYKGDLKESFIHLKNTLKTEPNNLPAKVLLGKILTENGEATAALDIFQEALLQKADINLILEDYTTVLLLLKKYQEVLDIDISLLKTDALRFELLLARGNAYQQLSLTQLAEDEFVKASQLLPTNTRAINALAVLYIQQDQTEQAKSLIDESLKLEPNNPRTLHLQGRLYAQLGDIKAELDSYQKAMTIDNTDPFISRSLVAAYVKNERYSDAQVLIEEILESTPNDPRMKVLLSWLLSMDQKQERSQQLLQDVVTSLSLYDEASLLNDPSLILINAVSLLNQQNWEAAQKELLRYLELDPNNLQAIHFLSEVYLQTGEVREAIDLLESNYSLVIKTKDLGLRLLNLYKQESINYEFQRLLQQLYDEFSDDAQIAIQYASQLSKSGRVRQAREVLDRLANESKASQAYQLVNGIILLENGNVEAAKEISSTLLNGSEVNSAVYGFAGAVEIKDKQADAAETMLRKALELAPNTFEVKFNLATALKMQGKLLDALNIIDSLESEQPSNVSVALLRAQILSESGQKRKAVEALESIERVKLTDTSALLLFGLYNELNELDNALKIINLLNSNSLYNRRYMLMKIDTLVKLERIDEAKRQLGILYGLAESDGRLLYDIAMWQRRIADFTGAEQTHQKLKRLIPNNLLVKAEYIRFLLAKNSLEQAKQLALDLVKQSKGNANAHHVLGDVYTEANEKKRAANQYYLAIEKDPNFDLVLLKLAKLAESGIEYNKTVELLEAKLNKNPQLRWVKQVLADLYFNSGETNKAQTYYAALIQYPEFNGNALIYNNLALLQLESSPQKALVTAKKAHFLQPNNANIIDTLAWTHAMNEQYGQALQLLRNAYAMDSGNLEIRYHLAYVLAKLERSVEAQIEIGAILNSNPSSELKQKASELQVQIDNK